ncbi:MAG: hypothetical protein JSV22_07140 [Bacteroidales bacterium]|nr:MAG: hypothetical protein JSV22_07140 [Bacteroidales bacterium]
MDKKILTPEESFDLINKAISNFKMNYKESGKSFLLWGWMICLACFSHFIIFKILQSKEAYEHMGLFSLGNWIVFMLTALIIQLFMQRKINKDKKVISHVEKYINNLWWVIAASTVVATFLCIKLEIIPPPLFLLIGGIATTITGLVIKFKPVIFGGLSFFLFSIASTLVSNENTLIIVGVAVICGYLIPGYLLKSAKE